MFFKKGGMKLSRFGREIVRKLVHLTGLVLVAVHAVFLFYWTERAAMLFLAGVLLVLLKVEYVRLEYKIKIPNPLNLFRRKEKDQVAGWIYFVSGMIIVLAAFDYPIALAALFMTIFGDMVAALMGMRFGGPKLMRNKTYVGTISGLVANIGAGWLALGANWPIIIVMAVTATVIELFTNKLDDNLTVPLSAAYAGHILLLLLGVEVVIADMPLTWLVKWLF